MAGLRQKSKEHVTWTGFPLPVARLLRFLWVVALYVAPRCGGTEYVRVDEGLTTIPGNIPLDVTHVDLSENQLTEVPDGSFSPYTSLMVLSLNRNSNLAVIGARALCGTVIGYLKLKKCAITSVPNITCIGDTLETLDLSHNRITMLNQGDFEGLSVLRTVWLSWNDIAGDVSPLSELRVSLERLYLAGNDIAQLNSTLYNFTSLTHLSLSRNKDLRLSEGNLAYCDNLESLHLTGCDLTEFPHVADALATLSVISLENNHLSNLSLEWLSQFRSLQELTLAFNEGLRSTIRVLEHWPGAQNLTKLDLSGVGLNKTILDQFVWSAYPKLEILQLAWNPFGGFPDLKNVTGGIRELDLSYTDLDGVPEGSLDHFESLEELDLSGNNFTTFHDLGGLLEINASLTVLDLGYNPLVDITGIYSLTNVQELGLRNTQIQCLPEVRLSVWVTVG